MRSSTTTPTTSTRVRDKLRQWTTDDPRSLVEIAIDAGMSRQQLNKVLHGDGDLMVNTLGRLLEALNRPWADLDDLDE